MSSTRIYYLFNGLLNFGLGVTCTMYSPFLVSIGLTYSEIALINAGFWAMIIASELPTGMLADGRSRAFSLRMGSLIFATGAVMYICAQGFWTALAAELVVAVGNAFLSGAQQAWIADALDREGKMDQLRRVYTNDMIIRASVFVSGGFMGTLLSLLSYRLIWIPLVLTGLGAAWIAWKQMNGQGEPIERVGEWEAFRLSWNHLTQSQALKWVIASMVVYGAVVGFNHYWAIYFQQRVGTIGLSWVWAAVYLGFMPSGWLVRRLGVPVGQESNWILVSLMGAGLSLVAVTLVGGLVAPMAFVMMHEFSRGLFQPLTDTFVQHRVKSSYRATFGSLQSFLGRAGFALVPFGVWLGIDGQPDSIATINLVWLSCGLALIVGGLFCWLFRPRIS